MFERDRARRGPVTARSTQLFEITRQSAPHHHLARARSALAEDLSQTALQSAEIAKLARDPFPSLKSDGLIEASANRVGDAVTPIMDFRR